MSDKDATELLRELAEIKRLADERVPLLSNQGQAMDGYTELAEYRAIAGRAQTLLARG